MNENDFPHLGSCVGKGQSQNTAANCMYVYIYINTVRTKRELLNNKKYR